MLEKYANLLMVLEEDMDTIDMDTMNLDMMDTDWIEEYENEDSSYELFYPEALSKIKVNILYVNTRNELEKMREELIYLSVPTGETLCKRRDYDKRSHHHPRTRITSLGSR